MPQPYTVIDHEATLAKKAGQARARRARKGQRKEATAILNGMKMLRVQEAVARAYRSKTTTTKDGTVRRRRLDAHVAAMCRQLLHWEGKGEAQGDWVHKTAFDWEHSEAGLTASMLKTARRIAREEGLIEEKPGVRRDKRATVLYRLDMWKLAQVVVGSELENARTLLASEGREEHKRRLRKQIRELEATEADLALIDGPEAPHEAPDDGADAHETAAGAPSEPHIHADAHDAHDTRANVEGDPGQLSALTVNTLSTSSLAGNPLGKAQPSPAPHTTPSPSSPLEPKDAGTAVEDEDEATAYEKLRKQVEAIVRGDCESASAREAIEPLVELHLVGGPYSIGVGVIAKAVRGFVQTRLTDEEADLPGMVEQIVHEMREEDGL